MEVKLTPQEAESYFYNSLCNGLSYLMDYGLELKYDSNDYKTAKKTLLENSKDTVCFEDVLLQILRNNKTITLIDNENGQESVEISILDVHERVGKTPIKHLIDAISENDDAETADVILQTVFYKEVIFG